MNLQTRSDRRSLSIHREVVKQLRKDPSLWDIPLRNIERWSQSSGYNSTPYMVWKDILTSKQHDEIITIMLSKSQRSTHLRSSSPFTGIISQETREKIFKRYSVK